MATTGTVNGRIVKFYTGALPGTAITCLTNVSLEFSMETRDTSCKDTTGNWDSSIAGTQSWTGSGEGNIAFDAANGIIALRTAFAAASTVVVSVTSAVSGDPRVYGNALLTSLSENYPDNENSTFSFSFKGVGAPTFATVS